MANFAVEIGGQCVVMGAIVAYRWQADGVLVVLLNGGHELRFDGPEAKAMLAQIQSYASSRG